jgi:glycosyltransferase involved in cell wall biosynthesis
MKLVHVIEKTFNSGAASSLKQIYEALSDSSVINEQDVICVNHRLSNKNIGSHFPVPVKQATFESVINDAKSEKFKDCVFVFHKLMCSPTKMFANLLWKTKCPYFVINHTYSDSNGFNKLFNFTECVCVSDHMSKKMKSINKNTNFYTIKNIVDFSYVSKFACTQEKNESFFKTGRINSLNAIKYNPEFVKWISSIKLSKQHIHEYIGTGQHYNEAYTLAESCKTKESHCVMVGSVNDEKIKFSKLKSWDLFVYHINRPEGTSMAVLESLAAGVPVICSNIPGNSELVINGVNGYTFESFSEAELILKNVFSDVEKLKRLKESTANWASENLNKNYFKKQYEEVINDIVENFKNKSSGNNKSYQKVSVSKNSRDTLIRQNIKKVVEERTSSKTYHKAKSLYPKGTNRTKHVIGSKVINKKTELKEVLGISTVDQRTFFPIINVRDINSYVSFYSDMIGISCENCDHNNPRMIYKKDYENCQYFIINTLDDSLEKLNDLEQKLFLKSDILYISNNNINNFKNLINKKNIWAENEK